MMGYCHLIPVFLASALLVGCIQERGQPDSPAVEVSVNVYNEAAPAPSLRPAPAGSQDARAIGVLVPASENHVVPPPPPVEESREPERLIRYFCRKWKDEDHLAMYGATDAGLRRSLSHGQFADRFEEDAVRTHGLRDERIVGKLDDSGSRQRWRVELSFRNDRAAARTVEVILVSTKDGYRIAESGIIPLDLNAF